MRKSFEHISFTLSKTAVHTLSALFTPALNGVNFRLAALKGPALKGPKNLNFFRKVALIF